jgi:hypothetical protein
VAPEAGRCLAGIAPEPPVELTSHTATLQENARSRGGYSAPAGFKSLFGAYAIS